MKKIVTLIAMLWAAHAYGAGVEFLGEPYHWNPVGTSTVYTQKIIFSGKKLSVIVHCGYGRVGTDVNNLDAPRLLPYGEEVFTKICGEAPPDTPRDVQRPEAAGSNSGSISAGDLPAIRKRVQRANKALSKRIAKGYLPMAPEEEAAYDQLVLNSKVSKIKDKGFLAECHYDKVSDDGRSYVTCNMFFPGKYQAGGVPLSYVRHMESVTSNVARSFRGPSTATAPSSSFRIMALVDIEGTYEQVCSFIYDREFDSMTPIYTTQY